MFNFSCNSNENELWKRLPISQDHGEHWKRIGEALKSRGSPNPYDWEVEEHLRVSETSQLLGNARVTITSSFCVMKFEPVQNNHTIIHHQTPVWNKTLKREKETYQWIRSNLSWRYYKKKEWKQSRCRQPEKSCTRKISRYPKLRNKMMEESFNWK